MIPLQLSEIAQKLDGRLLGEDRTIDSVTTDSRNCPSGSLFIALVGERFDAHDFLEKAQQAGASALLVEKKAYDALAEAQKACLIIPLIRVRDTRIGLGRLGAMVRDKVDPTVAAITGSNGKTSCKEMLASIMGQTSSVLATAGNFNNDIGVPLTLLRLEPEHQIAVVELGANHKGEIAYTSQLVRPSVALINNVAGAHLEGFGSLKGVSRAKGEILKGLSAGDTAVLNADSQFLSYFQQRRDDIKCVTFGQSEQADYQARDIQITAGGGSRFIACTPQGEFPLELHLPGRHNVLNALACTAMAVVLGASIQQVQEGLLALTSVKGRLHLQQLSPELTVFDDSYNANLSSVKVGLDVLAERDGYKVLVLGDMAELGSREKEHHQQIGEYAVQVGVDRVLTHGILSRLASLGAGDKGQAFIDKAALVEELLRISKQQPVSVLVKGSNSARMNEVIELLRAQLPKSNALSSQDPQESREC